MKRNVTRQAGFTLIELMIVVAILGVLAAVAIVAYKRYTIRAHNAEASSVLADIRLKQEAYRATFHRYANIGAWTPDNTPGQEPRAWDSGSSCDANCRTLWAQLGVAPDGQVYFSYFVEAGAPGDDVSGDATFGDFASLRDKDFWFAAQALQDLDGNGDYEGYEVYSGSSRMAEIKESDGVSP